MDNSAKDASTLISVLTITTIGFCKIIVKTLVWDSNFTHKGYIKNSVFWLFNNSIKNHKNTWSLKLKKKNLNDKKLRQLSIQLHVYILYQKWHIIQYSITFESASQMLSNKLPWMINNHFKILTQRQIGRFHKF